MESLTKLKTKVEELEERVRKLERKESNKSLEELINLVKERGWVDREIVQDEFSWSKTWTLKQMKRAGEKDSIDFINGVPGHPSLLIHPESIEGKEDYVTSIILRKMINGDVKKLKVDSIKDQYSLNDEEWKGISQDLIKRTRKSKNKLRVRRIRGNLCIVNVSKFYT